MSKLTSRLLAGMLGLSTISAFGQTYPSKPISFFVAYAPGGPTDTFARYLGAVMSERLHQPVVVDNKPGAAGQIAVGALKAQPADGHAMYLGDLPTLATNVGLFPNLTYRPQKELQAVTEFAVLPGMFVVPTSSPYQTMGDLIAAAKSGKELTYASHGIGSGAQLFSVLFAKSIGATMVHVPYKGSAPGLQAIMSSEVDFMYDTVLAGQYVKAGKMRALAVGNDTRLTQFPSVPTLKELGYADIVPRFWYGVVVRAGTPSAIVNTLDETIKIALRDPGLSKRFNDQGVILKTSASPEDFAASMNAETARWSKVIKEAGIKPD